MMERLDVVFLNPVKKLQSIAKLCGTNAKAQDDDPILWGLEPLLDDIAQEIHSLALEIEEGKEWRENQRFMEEHQELFNKLRDNPELLEKAFALAGAYQD